MLLWFSVFANILFIVCYHAPYWPTGTLGGSPVRPVKLLIWICDLQENLNYLETKSNYVGLL